MILAAGLTPAWQQAIVLDDFRPGAVNRAREVHWSASGKVFNAALAVHTLGADCRLLAPVGGPPRETIEQSFRHLGLSARWVGVAAATRVCTTLLDQASGTVTELVENGRPLAESELAEFRAAYEEEAASADCVILIGSLPERTPSSYYRELLATSAAPAILDFRGEGLLHCLDLEPLLVKPNREELARTFDRPLDDDRELVRAMHALNERGAQWVLVTDGVRPAWLTSAREMYRLTPPRVQRVVNPIGCGDALAGGVAVALSEGRDMPDAARLGMAAAAENLRHLLACRLDRAETDRLFATIHAEAIAPF